MALLLPSKLVFDDYYITLRMIKLEYVSILKELETDKYLKRKSIFFLFNLSIENKKSFDIKGPFMKMVIQNWKYRNKRFTKKNSLKKIVKNNLLLST